MTFALKRDELLKLADHVRYLHRRGILGVTKTEGEQLEQAIRLAAKPADEEWQDISTAPDNHLPVQVYGPYGQIVAFMDVTWAWWPIPAIDPLGYKPTHWRPLPAAPSITGEPKS